MWVFGSGCEPQELRFKCDYVTMSLGVVTCNEYDSVESGDASTIEDVEEDQKQRGPIKHAMVCLLSRSRL